MLQSTSRILAAAMLAAGFVTNVPTASIAAECGNLKELAEAHPFNSRDEGAKHQNSHAQLVGALRKVNPITAWRSCPTPFILSCDIRVSSRSAFLARGRS